MSSSDVFIVLLLVFRPRIHGWPTPIVAPSSGFEGPYTAVGCSDGPAAGNPNRRPRGSNRVRVVPGEHVLPRAIPRRQCTLARTELGGCRRRRTLSATRS